jgi:hypothetical protein
VTLRLAEAESRYVCHVTLLDAHDLLDASMMMASKSKQCFQNLYGHATVPVMLLKDLDGTKVLLFVFPDLSVRLHGVYTLSCQLINVKEYSTT